MSGRTLTSYVSERLSSDITETEKSDSYAGSRLTQIEERVNNIEKVLEIDSDDNGAETPFTQEEASHLNHFAKAFFLRQIKNKGITKKDGWMGLSIHLESLEGWSEVYSLRFKEALLYEEGDALTSTELNTMTNFKRIPCPILLGLFNWVNSMNPADGLIDEFSFPTRQQVCRKGVLLLDALSA